MRRNFRKDLRKMGNEYLSSQKYFLKEALLSDLLSPCYKFQIQRIINIIDEILKERPIGKF